MTRRSRYLFIISHFLFSTTTFLKDYLVTLSAFTLLLFGGNHFIIAKSIKRFRFALVHQFEMVECLHLYITILKKKNLEKKKNYFKILFFFYFYLFFFSHNRLHDFSHPLL